MKYSTQTKAIKAHCTGCIYDPLAEGTALQQIENCEIPQCELYEYRPLTGATKERLRIEKYEAMNETEQAKYREKQDRARKYFRK